MITSGRFRYGLRSAAAAVSVLALAAPGGASAHLRELPLHNAGDERRGGLDRETTTGQTQALRRLLLFLSSQASAIRPIVALPPSDATPYVDWPALLPALPTPYADPTERDCISGAESCIDRTIAAMEHHLNAVVPVCDHRAPFDLFYLRVTERFRRAIRAGVFASPGWVLNTNRATTRHYFAVYDDAQTGRTDRVPVAWRLAFDAARNREMSALGDLLMEANAHLDRDLPYVLAGTGIRNRDGTSRRPDHLRITRLLATAIDPILQEVARRFDPTAAELAAGPVDEELASTILQTFLEATWRNAERLADAHTETERRQVAASIESYAATVGRAIHELFRYRGGASSAARDAWCAAHGGQNPSSGSTAAQPGTAALVGTLRLRLGRGGSVRLSLRCPLATTGCDGLVLIEYRGATVGSKRFRIRAGEQQTLTVRLTPQTAAAARRRGSLHVQVSIESPGAAGGPGARSRPAVIVTSADRGRTRTLAGAPAARGQLLGWFCRS